MQKTTPSQDTRLPWVAGIIEGEGTIELFKPKKEGWKKRIGVSVTNTDILILEKVQEVCNDYGVNWVMYERSQYNHKNSFSHHKKCFGMHIRRHDDTLTFAKLIRPYMVGEKKDFTDDLIKYLEEYPRRCKKYAECELCKETFHRVYKNQRFCSQKCWKKYATGKNNPNYRHGKYQV